MIGKTVRESCDLEIKRHESIGTNGEHDEKTSEMPEKQTKTDCNNFARRLRR